MCYWDSVLYVITTTSGEANKQTSKNPTTYWIVGEKITSLYLHQNIWLASKKIEVLWWAVPYRGLERSFKQGSVNVECGTAPIDMVWNLQWCEIIDYGFFSIVCWLTEELVPVTETIMKRQRNKIRRKYFHLTYFCISIPLTSLIFCKN